MEGLDKAAVLAALYNGSRPQGMGFLHYDPTPMSLEEARTLIERSQMFDYLKGRVLKIDLSGDKLDPRGYDRDNGENTAGMLIDSLRETDDPNNPIIQKHHLAETRAVVSRTRELVHEDPSEFLPGERVSLFRLGLSDVADILAPKLREVQERLGEGDTDVE